jgi:hypothetical protein
MTVTKPTTAIETQTDYHNREQMVSVEPEPHTEETNAGEKI